MTSEISPKLPPSLLRLCYTLVFETPTGIRASLKHSLNAIPEEVMNTKPVERCRVYFLLLWFHAVVEERLRYVPVGWTKSYEFNESDLKCSLSVIDRWISAASRGLSHMDPALLNWKAIRCLLSESLYGGRVDNPFDDQLLHALIDRLFVPASFDSRFPLVAYCHTDGSRETVLTIPEGTCKADFEKWIDTLPVYNSPVWLGLPATAERRYLSQQGSYILRSSLLLQDQIDVEASLGEGANQASASGWMKDLAVQAESWLAATMVEIKVMQATPELLQNPVFRFLSRDIEEMKKLQHTVVHDLECVVGVCRGKVKSTHGVREVMRELGHDQVPSAWTVPGVASSNESE